MGRYRPPQPVGSKYITTEGHKRLTEEHDYLWRKKRPEVTRILSEAAAEGDRSENAEYIYRKKELREIDARVRFLRKRLDDMVIVDRIPKESDKVFFGAWVTIENDAGDEHTYRVVIENLGTPTPTAVTELPFSDIGTFDDGAVRFYSLASFMAQTTRRALGRLRTICGP